jgi:high-affinity K+ transport system ATPase subunit B
MAAQAAATKNIMASGDLDLGFLNKGGTISFGNLR